MCKIVLLVAGSRSFNDWPRFVLVLDGRMFDTLSNNPNVDEVEIISGGARGADAMAERYAKEFGFNFVCYPADWNTYKKSAGYRRNVDMGKACTHGVVFWDGQSKGAKHMIDILKGMNKPCEVVRV